MLLQAPPYSQVPSTPAITVMNHRILSFDLGEGALDSSAMDAHIEVTLEAMFDGTDPSNPCSHYYCTGYWPAGASDVD